MGNTRRRIRRNSKRIRRTRNTKRYRNTRRISKRINKKTHRKTSKKLKKQNIVKSKSGGNGDLNLTTPFQIDDYKWHERMYKLRATYIKAALPNYTVSELTKAKEILTEDSIHNREIDLDDLDLKDPNLTFLKVDHFAIKKLNVPEWLKLGEFPEHVVNAFIYAKVDGPHLLSMSDAKLREFGGTDDGNKMVWRVAQLRSSKAGPTAAAHKEWIRITQQYKDI